MALQYWILIYAVLTSILFLGTNALGKNLEWKQKSTYILFSILDGILLIILCILYFT